MTLYVQLFEVPFHLQNHPAMISLFFRILANVTFWAFFELNSHHIDPSKPTSSLSLQSANWICSWLLIKSRGDLHKVRSFACGRQPLPPYMSESWASSQEQGRKLTSEREIRREEGTHGGEQGGDVCQQRRRQTADGGKEETNGGKQQLVPWDGGISAVDMHILHSVITHPPDTHTYTHARTNISTDFAIKLANW